MKKITSLLIGCCLALAGVVLAQQPEAQQSPTKKGGTKQKAPPAETRPKPTGEQTRAPETGAGAKQPGAGTRERERGAAGATASATPTREEAAQGRKAREENAAKARASATPAMGAAASATPPRGATATPGVATGQGQANRTANRAAAKPNPQQVQQIKQQHSNFHAQPRPDKAPAVTFNTNHRIEGAERWQGQQYEVFRSYHPEWHEQGWYRSHYTRVELIGGGWYFWNNGYWFPAWGYDPGVAYYAYDGPIYVGHRAEPPDQVIADVQAELKEMGYYQGEVDGLLGPLTRQALRDYQGDHDLAMTEAIDQPTLDSLQLS